MSALHLCAVGSVAQCDQHAAKAAEAAQAWPDRDQLLEGPRQQRGRASLTSRTPAAAASHAACQPCTSKMALNVAFARFVADSSFSCEEDSRPTEPHAARARQVVKHPVLTVHAARVV